MVRPKTILWVDDEVEGLAAHRRFLEDQGFTVAAAAHGDDALALLRRQAYSIVLLDERSEEHTSELSHSQISYAVFCLKKKKTLTLDWSLESVIYSSDGYLFRDC